MGAPLLEAKGLKKYFPVTKGLVFMKVEGWIKAVDGVDFSLREGETLGLVGESGCGKTTTGNLILRLTAPTAGAVFFRGKDISQFTPEELKAYRSSVQAVFQDPFSSLSPRMRVEDIIAEPLEATNSLPQPQVRGRVGEMLEMVGLGAPMARLFPHEFSGGQRQRIAIARALSSRPRLVVLDEAVSGLDVSIRAQIINLLEELQHKLGVSYLFIGHDLAVVSHISQRLAVMYLGKIVETGDCQEACAHPLHPYAQALFSAALPSHPDEKGGEIVLTGEVPSPLNPPAGCHFHPRCSNRMPVCSQEEPPLKGVAPHHLVACHLY